MLQQPKSFLGANFDLSACARGKAKKSLIFLDSGQATA